MRRVKMEGTLLLDAPGVLMEIAPVQKKGMEEFTRGQVEGEWHQKKFDKICAKGKVFYRLHPEALDFIRCFSWNNTYPRDGKSVNLCGLFAETTYLAEYILQSEIDEGRRVLMSDYFNHEHGWVIVSSLAPTSAMMPVILSRRFHLFERNVMGLPKRRILEIVRAVMADHYIQFKMYDGKGGFNPLLELVPRIEEALKKPRFPTEEIHDFCTDDDD